MRTSEEMGAFWADWARQYPILSIEDGCAEDDWKGWKHLSDLLGVKVRIAHQIDQKGVLSLDYASLEQLDMLCQRLTGEQI